MNHLCATLLIFCVTTPSLNDDRATFINNISQCAVNYNSYYADPVDRITIHIVVAIAAHESGWGTSRFVLEGNNYFGIRAVEGEEYMTALNNHNAKLAIYINICESVYGFMDLIIHDERYSVFMEELWRMMIMDHINYDKLLSSMNYYSVDPKWKEKVKAIIEQIK